MKKILLMSNNNEIRRQLIVNNQNSVNMNYNYYSFFNKSADIKITSVQSLSGTENCWNENVDNIDNGHVQTICDENEKKFSISELTVNEHSSTEIADTDNTHRQELPFTFIADTNITIENSFNPLDVVVKQENDVDPLAIDVKPDQQELNNVLLENYNKESCILEGK